MGCGSLICLYCFALSSTARVRQQGLVWTSETGRNDMHNIVKHAKSLEGVSTASLAQTTETQHGLAIHEQSLLAGQRAQSVVPRWLKLLVGGLALMGGARADQQTHFGAMGTEAKQAGLISLNQAQPSLHAAGLLYNTELLHSMPPTLVDPKHKYNVKQFEALGQLPEDTIETALKYGQYGFRVRSPKYEPSKADEEFDQNVWRKFEAMAEKVVHNNEARYSGTATPSEIDELVSANIGEVGKYLKFLLELENKERFQNDWNNRVVGTHERQVRQIQFEFLVHVAESTLAHFAETRTLASVDVSVQTRELLRDLRGIVELVVVGDKLDKVGYKPLKGPEHDLLDRIDNLLIPKKDRISAWANDVENREADRVWATAASVLGNKK